MTQVLQNTSVDYVDEVPLRHKKIETSLTHRDSSKIRDVLNISKDVPLASVAQSPLDSSIVKKVYKATKKMYGNKQRNTSTLYGIVGGSPCTENDDSRSRSREVRNKSSYDIIKGDHSPPGFHPRKKITNFFEQELDTYTKTFGKPTEVFKPSVVQGAEDKYVINLG